MSLVYPQAMMDTVEDSRPVKRQRTAFLQRYVNGQRQAQVIRSPTVRPTSLLIAAALSAQHRKWRTARNTYDRRVLLAPENRQQTVPDT